MGSKFAESRRRSFREVRRSAPVREPYEVVLIVCEGAKTEPYYFKELIRELRLSAANVHVIGEECGSSPKTIVKYAVDRFGRNDGYDRVFCVFDKDSHPDFDEAKDRCRALSKSPKTKGIEFLAVTSNPCFEFWLLLHVKDASAPYAKTGKKSVGDLAAQELGEAIGSYQKGRVDVFAVLRPGLDEAIRRAQRLRAQELENPYTDVDELVLYLRGLAAGR